jgi:hypothetical protein
MDRKKKKKKKKKKKSAGEELLQLALQILTQESSSWRIWLCCMGHDITIVDLKLLLPLLVAHKHSCFQ